MTMDKGMKRRCYASGGLVSKGMRERDSRMEAAMGFGKTVAPAAVAATPATPMPVMNPTPVDAARAGMLSYSGANKTAVPAPRMTQAPMQDKGGYMERPKDFKKGGKVKGPGTGTSDSIPANLSNGEFVVKAASTKKIGTAALTHMNENGSLPKGMPRRMKKSGKRK